MPRAGWKKEKRNGRSRDHNHRVGNSRVHSFYLYIFCFLGPHWWHMEVPRLRGPSRATAASLHHSYSNWNPSLVCHLHLSSRQHWVLNPLSKAGDGIPSSSWMLVGFVTAEPQQELPPFLFIWARVEFTVYSFPLVNNYKKEPPGHYS